MNDDPDLVVFPDISDEAVIALDQFLEEFYARFQNHYFAQMHRHYAGLPIRLVVSINCRCPATILPSEAGNAQIAAKTRDLSWSTVPHRS
jgi:hypothetical protein